MKPNILQEPWIHLLSPSPLLLIIHSQIAWWFMKTAIMLPRVLHSNSQFWLFKSNIGWMVGCKGDLEPVQGFFIPFWSTITQDTYFLSDTWLHESCICKWLVYLKRIYDCWLRNSRKYLSQSLNHFYKYIVHASILNEVKAQLCRTIDNKKEIVNFRPPPKKCF